MLKHNSININVHFQHLTARTAIFALVKSENWLAILVILVISSTFYVKSLLLPLATCHIRADCSD